jgi:PKD repeat protein
MKKLIAITIGLLAGITSISAQNWCGTVEHHQKLYADNPELADALEKRLEAFNRLQEENAANGVRSDDHHIIPVVFHVIHEGGTENIPLTQIKDQIRILNEDFARLNADTTNTPPVFAEYAGDTRIEFRLAKIDPDGNCTEGVTRTYSNLTNDAYEKVKTLIQWDSEHYLNVWVVKSIENFSDSDGMILGFAQFPNLLWSKSETDGIVIRQDRCGSIGTAEGVYGRTLTHEAGHWLNLKHIWGDDECGNDEVKDTPAAKEANYSVCTNDFPWHVGSCEAGSGQTITQESGEMFMNYMDYSDDYCQNMFSLGQGKRMRSALTTYRSNLIAESNLIATGTSDNHVIVDCAPIAEFKTNYIYGCTGDGFNYENNSYNTPIDSISSYEWTFEGGTPSSSTEQNPLVVYNESGVFNTTLIVTNRVGSSTTTKEAYVNISPENADMPAPYFQNFESDEFPTFDNNPHWNWTVSASEDPSWQRYTIENGVNNASFRIRSSEFGQLGKKHILITPSIDLSNTSSPVRAYFDLSHARRNGNSNDQLAVSVSKDCGRTWTKRFDKDTDALVTNGGGNHFFAFSPTDSQWEPFRVNLNGYAGESNVILKFEFSGEQGNWLYIDNFVVCNSNELFLNDHPFTELNIFPNPSKGDATIEFELYQDAEIQIALSNIYGAVLAQENLELKAAINSIQLKEIYAGLKAGVYFVQLKQNGSGVTKKIVITD